MNTNIIDAYERVALPCETHASQPFLYALHYSGANSLQIGFGTGSFSGLQLAHIAGPHVHELHVDTLVAWLKQAKPPVRLMEKVEGKLHPLTSGGQDIAGYDKLLRFVGTLDIQVGRFEPLVPYGLAPPEALVLLANAIDRVRNAAWGHRLDWDARHTELLDGRFLWIAYDSEIDKIRMGMGCHTEGNEKAYGRHAYAVSGPELGSFAAFHFSKPDLPLQFMGLPPRWPSGLNPFLYGEDKQRFITDLYKLGDEVWPGTLP